MYVTKTFHDDEMLTKHKKKIEANPTTMLDIKMFYVFQNQKTLSVGKDKDSTDKSKAHKTNDTGDTDEGLLNKKKKYSLREIS